MYQAEKSLFDEHPLLVWRGVVRVSTIISYVNQMTARCLDDDLVLYIWETRDRSMALCAHNVAIESVHAMIELKSPVFDERNGARS